MSIISTLHTDLIFSKVQHKDGQITLSSTRVFNLFCLSLWGNIRLIFESNMWYVFSNVVRYKIYSFKKKYWKQCVQLMIDKKTTIMKIFLFLRLRTIYLFHGVNIIFKWIFELRLFFIIPNLYVLVIIAWIFIHLK